MRATKVNAAPILQSSNYQTHAEAANSPDVESAASMVAGCRDYLGDRTGNGFVRDDGTRDPKDAINVAIGGKRTLKLTAKMSANDRNADC